jgi:hypothetical protein
MKPIFTHLHTALLVAIVGIVSITATRAQVAVGYNFTTASSTYTPITGGTALASMSANIDDETFTNLNIGFPFVYDGTVYNNFGINANGVIVMGTGTPSSIFNLPLSAAANNNAIAAFGGDIQGDTSSSLRYQTIGAAPNRVCVVQWTHFHRFGQAIHNVNFQIRLYETSNNIGVVYGTIATNSTNNFNVQVGIRGNGVADFNSRTTTTNWGATSRAMTIGATCSFTNAAAPVSGLVFQWSPCTVGEDCFAYPTISGKTYIDFNNDGIFDPTDMPLPNRVISTNGGYATATNAMGNFHLLADTSHTTLLSTPANSPHFTVQPATISIAATGQSAQTFPNSDFRLVPNGVINDLAVTIHTGRTRPGFQTLITLTYSNIGTTVLDGDLTFAMNTGSNQILQFVSADAPFTTQSGNVTNFAYANLQPFETRQITVTAFAPVTASVGAYIHNQWSGTVNGIETDLTNNLMSDSTQVRTSFDPNDKTANTDGITAAELASNKRIIYTINFQNTGTDAATFVKIRDTLSNDLNIALLQTVATSHPNYYLQITTDKTQTPARNIATWSFDNINLDYASHNEPASHGFVQFSVPAQQNLPLGTQIDNIAHIIFDYNTPVTTNTATVRVREITNTTAATFTNWTLAPNPTAATVSLRLPNTEKIAATVEIYNALGQILNTVRINETNTTLDLTAYPNDVYTIVLRTATGSNSKLVIKE